MLLDFIDYYQYNDVHSYAYLESNELLLSYQTPAFIFFEKVIKIND